MVEHSDTHSFIVRIWHEAYDGEGHVTAWRGSIERVGDDKRLYFHDLEAVQRFIQEQAGVGNGRPGKWKSWLARMGNDAT